MRETYKLDFKVSNKRERVAVTLADRRHVSPTSDRDTLARSLRTVGDVANALLMITMVGAQPIWVMWFMVVLWSW